MEGNDESSFYLTHPFLLQPFARQWRALQATQWRLCLPFLLDTHRVHFVQEVPGVRLFL